MLDLVIKYLLEGAAVAVAAFYIPQRKVDLQEIALIAVTAAAVFMVLDFFAPSVSVGARQGTGFGIGYKMVGGDPNAEPSAQPPAQPKPAQVEAPATPSTTSSSGTPSETFTSETSEESNDDNAPGPAGATDSNEHFTSQPAPLLQGN
jgi:hypothetical protein